MRIITGSLQARRALRMLVQEGCDQERVIELVHEYCRGASAEDARKSLQFARGALRRWMKLSKELVLLADMVENTIKEMSDKTPCTLNYREDHHPAAVMREFADMVAKCCKSLKPDVNPRSGRNETLAYLCYLVLAATDKEHYAEIAAIVSTYKGQENVSQLRLTKDADAIRNRVARFGANNVIPGTDRVALREEAEDEVRGWKLRK